MSRDRGIKKWAPYKTLEEQWTSLNEMNNRYERIQKPELSDDQIEHINNILSSYHNQKLIITIYKNGKIFKLSDEVIKKIDIENKKILLGSNRSIYFDELINLTSLEEY